MVKINKLKEFDYGRDMLVVGDVDNKDKGYIIKMSRVINELVDTVNQLVEDNKNMAKEFEKRVLAAEKEAADLIKNSVKKENKK